MKKRAILFILILIISAFSAYALDLSYEATQNKVLSGDDAKFLLEITNNAETSKTVTFRSLSYDWELNQEKTSLTLKPHQVFEYEISYTPVLERKPGSYGVSLILETEEDKIEKFLTIQVLETKNIISAEILNPTVDPRKTHLLKINLENIYYKDLTDLTFTISTDFLSEMKTLDLKKETSKEIDFEFDLPDTTTEGTYNLHLEAIGKDGVAYLNEDQDLIISKFSNLIEVNEQYSGFLISGEKITQTNDGNEILELTHTIDVSVLSKKFTKFDPMPEFIEDGELFAVWTYTLTPGETITIDYKSNYGRPLIITIVILILLGLFYTFVKKPIAIKKKVITLRNSKGEIGIMKVMITIKNKTKFPLKNISIVDKAPKAIKVPTEFGSCKPESITNMGEGIRLSWNLSGLRGKQEKVITYKVSKNMKLEGNIKLPPAMASVRKGARKFRVTSNSESIREM